VPQRLVELFFLFTELGYLSFKILDMLPGPLSNDALRFSVICPFSLELSI
jgi:hypothetical protein